jgi:hypothetical protein
MAAEGLGRIYEHSRGRHVLYIPTAVLRDTAFPFEVGQRVVVRIEGTRLVVRPAPTATTKR